jgi:signal peptidase I
MPTKRYTKACGLSRLYFISNIIINLIGMQSVMFEPDSQSIISAVTPRAEPTASPGAFWSLLLQEIVQVVLPALILALVVHLYLAQATVVYGQSMEPNLSARQRLIVDKISYRLRAPQRDDIVVLNVPEISDLLVKRIVGLPGEVIEIRDGSVMVNGQTLPEPFPHGTMPQNMARWLRSNTLLWAITAATATTAVALAPLPGMIF